MVEVFRLVRELLNDSGVLWLNLGDSYASGKGSCYNLGGGELSIGKYRKENAVYPLDRGNKTTLDACGLKPKDLVGIPWRVAFALQADGWFLRSDIIWAKAISFCDEYSGTCMPESVTDRPTKSHEYLFLFSKSQDYFYDQDSTREKLRLNRWSMGNTLGSSNKNIKTGDGAPGQSPHSWERTGHSGYFDSDGKPLFNEKGRNLRSVWAINPKPYKEAHFATFPPSLIEPCILAGSRKGDIVLDPFFGSGTTGQVAEKHGRDWIGIDLNPKYYELAKKRTAQMRLIV